ncbi:hypothetical protein K440DRAFT_265714 [Wilcoxina mikolae CBS 423.85]|nr:hypothetical protein K440DRAFT_265714 [Wilcoxina mikolae CBS 423.85]
MDVDGGNCPTLSAPHTARPHTSPPFSLSSHPSSLAGIFLGVGGCLWLPSVLPKESQDFYAERRNTTFLDPLPQLPPHPHQEL